ncbi:MAG TPA: SMC-Scp complex subunit ScpB [Saprospiraceae bacterium]|nr:SMC-Scp complex subunit ScpB [Saprospiraceae bacterium]
MNLEQYFPAIESLIFASPQPVSAAEIKYCLENTLGLSMDTDLISDAVYNIQQKYEGDAFGIEIKEIAGGYQFLSKPKHFDLVAEHIKLNNRKKLTRAAMESLAIIAYKQPVSKSEIEAIRGVNSDHSIQKLLEKELIEIKGRSEGPGRPILFGTSQRFMEYFGLKDLAELPRLKDFALSQEIGEPAPVEMDVKEEEAHQIVVNQSTEDE